jgi:hypothetical protein
MPPQLSPTLLKILSSTVLEVERSLRLPQGDPSLRDLKQTILLALGELEWKRTAGSRIRILWIRPESAGVGYSGEREGLASRSGGFHQNMSEN